MSLQGPDPLWLSTAIRLCPISFPRLGYNCSFFHHFSPSSIKDMHEAPCAGLREQKSGGDQTPLRCSQPSPGHQGWKERGEG